MSRERMTEMNELEAIFDSEKAGKWNRQRSCYEKYSLPAGARLVAEKGQTVACAGCGKPVRFEDSYVSGQIHNPYGIGFLVCGECHQAEIGRRKRAKK